MKNFLICKYLCLLSGFFAVTAFFPFGVQNVHAQPVILSTMPLVNQRVVTRFNLGNFERIRQNQYALSCLYMQDCYPAESEYGEGEHVDETTFRGQMGACSPCQPACSSGLYTAMPCYGGGSLWFQNYGDFVTQQARYPGLHGYHADSYGLSFGYDILTGYHSVFGVAVGGAFSDAKAKNADQKNETDSFLVALYGNTNVHTWNVVGSIGYVHSAFETHRSSYTEPGERLYSNHHGETMFGSFEISSAVFQQSLCMTPFLAYDFIRMKENGYDERWTTDDAPDDALKIGKRRSTSYLQTLGLRFERAYYENGGWLVQPSFSIGWLHDYGQRRIFTNAVLDGQRYKIKGTAMNKNRLVVSLGVTASMGNRTSLFARYDGEYNRRYNAQTVQFGFGLGY